MLLGETAVLAIVKGRTCCERLEAAQGKSIEGLGPIGVLARVVVSGPIRVGDPVAVVETVGVWAEPCNSRLFSRVKLPSSIGGAAMRRLLLILPVGILVLLVLSALFQLDFPRPTGPHAVGRTTWRWTDDGRPEPMTDDPADKRQIVAEVWYPAAANTGTQALYVHDLMRLADPMAAGGELSPLVVWGLRLIGYHGWREAAVADAESAYPVILLSPGNATNVEFYSGLADELASHGYLVVGLNHPYDVTAVALAGGEIAAFVSGPATIPEHESWTTVRMVERVADIRFALDRLSAVDATDAMFAGRLDLTTVGVMGHSLGGVAAAMTCEADERFDACLNLDGIQRGGPFSTREADPPPAQPFMFITKEETLPAAAAAQFASIPGGSYRVVVHGAAHDSFTDGPLLRLSLLPGTNAADRILQQTRSYMVAFFDQSLQGGSSELLTENTTGDRVSLEVYCVAGKPDPERQHICQDL